MEPRSSFVNLHVHSSFSLLDGCLKIKDAVAKAKAHAMPACVITDHGNMHAMVKLFKECKAQEIKPIIGTEFYVAPAGVGIKDEAHKKSKHLILLAKDEVGRHNLTQLNTLSQSESAYYYKPRIDWPWIMDHHEGLVCLSGCCGGELAQAIIKADAKVFWETLRFYRELFGDDYYLEIQTNTTFEQRAVNLVLKQVAEQEGLPLVLTSDTHYLNQEDSIYHDLLLRIQTRCKPGEVGFKFPTNEFFFYTPEDIYRVAQDDLDVRAIMNTLEVAEKCHLVLELGKLYMPNFDISLDRDWQEYTQEIEAA